MRLAWFSPWPPDPSGIAGRSAELVPILSDRGHGIDIFVDERRVPDVCRASAAPPRSREMRVQSAHDFLWRAERGQYDLAVYQIGNSRLHDYMWPYLWQTPGLAVLHDTRLHHARGGALLSRRRVDAYRAEFAWSEPHVAADAAELAIAGFSGAYYYQWPMTAAVVGRSRLIAAHARGALQELEERYPGRPFCHIALGEGTPVPTSEAKRHESRRRFGLSSDALVFGVFGGLTTEKRVGAILRAFAAIRRQAGAARLLLAGEPDADLDLRNTLEAMNLGGAVVLTGRLDDQSFDQAIAAADVSLNLRWPSSGEMSGPWVRALAAARPTIITDLAHLAEIPTLDPRTWQLHAPAPEGCSAADAIAVAIDVLDEEHSLRTAMRRLASDAPLRDQIGRAARAHWEGHHTVAHMADDYEAAMTRAATLPVPQTVLPSHLLPDAMAHARGLVSRFDVADRLPS